MTFLPSNLLINILITADIADERNTWRIGRDIRAITRYAPRHASSSGKCLRLAVCEFEFIMALNRYLVQ